jgi:hypothetical protein
LLSLLAMIWTLFYKKVGKVLAFDLDMMYSLSMVTGITTKTKPSRVDIKLSGSRVPGKVFLQGETMNYKYSVTRLFVSGNLKGIAYTGLTNVQFMEGREYGSIHNGGRYLITDVMYLD